MRFTFLIEAGLEHGEGRPASYDELAGLVQATLENTDPLSLYTDDGARYDINQWTITAQPRTGAANARTNGDTPTAPHP